MATPAYDPALEKQLYDQLLASKTYAPAAPSAGGAYNGLYFDKLAGLGLQGIQQAMAPFVSWQKSNPGKTWADYQAATNADANYAKYGSGGDRATFDPAYSAASQRLDSYWSSLPALGIPDNPEYPTANYYGAPSQVRPIGTVDGKILYPEMSYKMYSGNDRRESWRGQGWVNPDWVSQQAQAGRLSTYTYKDANGKEHTGILADPSIVTDPNFKVDANGQSYRNNADLNGGGLGGFGMALSIGLAFATGGASALGNTLFGLTEGTIGAGLAGGAVLGASNAALTGGNILEGAVKGGVVGGITTGITGGTTTTGGVAPPTLSTTLSDGGSFGDILKSGGLNSYYDAADKIGSALGINTSVAGNLVDSSLKAGVMSSLSTAANGGNFGDILRSGVSAGGAGLAGGAVTTKVANALDGNAAQNTIAGAAGGATAGAINAVLGGHDVTNGVLIGGAGGAAAGAWKDLGGNPNASGAVSSIAKTATAGALAPTPSTNNTPATSSTNTATTAANSGNLGLTFGDVIAPQFARAPRADMHWGERIAA